MGATLTDKTALLQLIDEEAAELMQLTLPLDNIKLNTIPYEDGWTAAQLDDHVAKSTALMSQGMLKPSKPATRDAGEKIPVLKKTFLDFLHKMKSPEMIVPDNGPFEKSEITTALKSSFKALKENAFKANLNELVEGLPLGEITKLELLHFVLYHTKRHVHQMRKIAEALENK